MKINIRGNTARICVTPLVRCHFYQITRRYVADDRNFTVRTSQTSQRLDPV
jgi:hypothetical protein